MQSLQDTAADSTPYSTADEQEQSPMANNSTSDIDPLIARMAKKLAVVINDFKRELDQRDGMWVDTRGAFEISIKSETTQNYELVIVPDEDGDEYPISVQARLKKGKSAVNGDSNAITSTSTTAYTPVKRASDIELEKDLVSRKKRKLDEDDGQDGSRKRPRAEEDEDDDIMPLISKDDLEELLGKLRDDIQEDTSECVNHVQRLLRRFKEEWHEKSKWEYEKLSAIQSAPGHPQMPVRGSVERNAMPEAFPSPALDRDDHTASVQDFIRRENKLLSSQIRWVEECRRVASVEHDKREETWRTSSASFHDRNRQDREAFQARMLQDSTMHARMLTQILTEVKGLANVTMSLKWETPEQQLQTQPTYPPQPSVPAFPTAPAPERGASRSSTSGYKR